MKNQLRPMEILLVEDEEGDIILTRLAFEESPYKVNLNVVRDGEMAIDFLHHNPPYQGTPRPDLILLDINMPRKDGLEVLEEVKSDADLGSIPIAILTTSEAEEDILRAYHHANCYIRKPIEIDRFSEVVREIEIFWLETVMLPPR
jgi:two-component system response regulator